MVKYERWLGVETEPAIKTAHGIRSSDFACLHIVTLAVSVGGVGSSTGQKDQVAFIGISMSNNLEVYMALAAQVSYDPESGIFAWLPRKGETDLQEHGIRVLRAVSAGLLLVRVTVSSDFITMRNTAH